jgi:hypothetical protein
MQDAAIWFYRSKGERAQLLVVPSFICCCCMTQLSCSGMLGGQRCLHSVQLCEVSCRAEHYADELEEMLDEAMQHDFNVDAEDGSPSEVLMHPLQACELVAAGVTQGCACMFIEEFRLANAVRIAVLAY